MLNYTENAKDAKDFILYYIKKDDKTVFYFKNGKSVDINFSYYIIDNQVTRSLMLDYEIRKRRESLEK